MFLLVQFIAVLIDYRTSALEFEANKVSCQRTTLTLPFAILQVVFTSWLFPPPSGYLVNFCWHATKTRVLFHVLPVHSRSHPFPHFQGSRCTFSLSYSISHGLTSIDQDACTFTFVLLTPSPHTHAMCFAHLSTTLSGSWLLPCENTLIMALLI